MSTNILLMIYVFGMVAGQLLFKITANRISSLGSINEIVWFLARDWVFFLALALYGILTLYWIWLLNRVAISYAYPFVALSIAMVVGSGWIFWGEKLVFLHGLGVLLVMAGVILIGVSGE